MRVVDDPVEDGVGIGRMVDDLVPAVHGDLAGDDGRLSAVPILQDLEEVMAGGIVERFQAPVVEDQELGTREGAHDPGVSTIAAGGGEIGKELGDPLIEDGSVVAAGAVADGGRQPTLPHAGRAGQDQIVVGGDEVAGAQFLEESAVETAGCLVIDILDDGLMTQLGVSKPGRQAPVATMADLTLDQKTEPFGMGKPCDLARCLDLGEGLGHAGEAELAELFEGGMGQHDDLLLVIARATRMLG